MTTDALADDLHEVLSVFERHAGRGEPLTTPEVSEHLDISRRGTYARLERLAEAGELETKKAGARGRVWWRPAAVPASSGTAGGDGSQKDEPADTFEGRNRKRELAVYEALFEESKDVNVVVDADGRYQHVTPSARNVLGYDPEALVGEVGFDYIHPEDREMALREFAKMVEDPDYEPSVEFRFEHADGSWVVLEALGRNLLDDPDVEGIVVYTRDVTDRIERERTLQWREEALRRAYDVIVDPARSFEETVDELLGIVRSALGTDFAALSRVREDDVVVDAVRAPQDAGIEAGRTVPILSTICEPVVDAGETLALANVSEEAPDLAGRPAGADWAIESYLGAPVVVDGSVYGTFCFYDDEPREAGFSSWEVTFVELLGNWLSQELEQRRYTDRLAALNDLHEVLWDVADAAIEQSTRSEIEATVCERLAAADSYRFAWIGDVDRPTGEVTVRSQADAAAYLEEITITVDPDDERARGPTGRAFKTGEVQTVRDVDTDPGYEPWRDAAGRHGFASSAAIPIRHEGTIYGVLNVYADRPRAFEGPERAVVGQLGEVVGHAIAAVERKRALMGDEVVELEFHTPDVFDHLGVEGAGEGRIDIEETVPIGDGDFLVYGTASAAAREDLEVIVEGYPHWESLTIRGGGADGARTAGDRGGGADGAGIAGDRGGDGHENVGDVNAGDDESDAGSGDRDVNGDDAVGFEVRVTEPPVLSRLASLGGSIEEATIEDGEYRLAIRVSPSVDVRTVIEAVDEAYPGAEVIRQRQVDRAEDPIDRAERALLDDLTERQRSALRAAYHAGFFDWPRESSGEEVAESLGVTAPTLHQHLRRAEQKVFDALL